MPVRRSRVLLLAACVALAAAPAGKGIILIQQRKEAQAQAPLRRALAINPWLKERNLVSSNPVPVP